MGLLTQGLYGAIGQGADTAAKVMLDDIHAQRDDELAKAQDLRTQNLMRLRSQLGRADFAAQQDATYSPYTVDTGNGPMPATYADVKAARAKTGELKDQMGLLSQAANERQNQAILEAQKKGETGETSEDDLNQVQAAGQLTPEEVQKANDIAANAPKVANTKEDALNAKLDTQKEMMQSKLDMQKEVAQIREAAYKERTESILKAAEDKLQMAFQLKQLAVANGSSSALKEAHLAILKAEEQRKNANAAQKLLNEGNMDDPSTVSLFNKYMTDAGMPESVKGIPTPKAAKQEKKGLIDSITGMFGSGESEAAPSKPAATPAINHEDIDAQAQAAIMQVYANRKLTPAQQQQKIAAINARRNSLVGG